jgi:hypothetical protein
MSQPVFAQTLTVLGLIAVLSLAAYALAHTVADGREGRHVAPYGWAADASQTPTRTPALVVVDPTGPVVMRQEQTATGAETWGSLLDQMNTEERTIYHMETYLLHQDVRGAIDPAVQAFSDRIDAILEGWNYRTERVGLGSTETPTGAWPVLAGRPI